MLRNLIAVLVGLIVGVQVNTWISMDLSSIFYQLPAELTQENSRCQESATSPSVARASSGTAADLYKPGPGTDRVRARRAGSGGFFADRPASAGR